ncbi:MULTISPECIES: response regulator [Gordonia]|nr:MULTISPECIES: response regulator transcription factor [Gordonia]
MAFSSSSERPVVIADDQTVVREGLRSMLGLFDSLDVVGVASSAEDALALVAEQTPDVLLTDLRMPGIGGIEGIRRLVTSGAATRAVALTTYDDDATIVAALDAGAVGFLNKDADPTAIESALLSAAAVPS